MSKEKGAFLRDPESGILWLHCMSMDSYYRMHFHDKEIDLATCEQEVHEIVSGANWGLSMASLDYIVAKNEKGLYAFLTPYQDSMGYGAIYASITPGFTFKSVYAFVHNNEIYVIGEDEEERWGMIRITAERSSAWLKCDYPDCYEPIRIPIEIVPFGCESMSKVMDTYPITFTLRDFLDRFAWSSDTTTTIRDREWFRDECREDNPPMGTTLEEIKSCRQREQ